METITSILDIITHFVFNWTTYFWSIPIWFGIFVSFATWINKEKITIGDLGGFFILSLVNPIWYLFFGAMLLVAPFVFLIVWSDNIYDIYYKIKNKI